MIVSIFNTSTVLNSARALLSGKGKRLVLQAVLLAAQNGWLLGSVYSLIQYLRRCLASRVRASVILASASAISKATVRKAPVTAYAAIRCGL